LGIIARLALFLVGALALCGCGTPASDRERDWPPPSLALWHVTAPDGSGEGWLFGTVHALPEGLSWRTAALDDALAHSGVLVVEIADLGDGLEARAAFEDFSQEPGLPPLVERVPSSERARLEAVLAKAGLEADAFAGTGTWAAALLLASALRTHDPALGVDRALIDSADEVLGLESFAGQYQRFDSLSQAAQIALLHSVLDKAGDTQTDAHVEAWLTGDLAGLERMSQDSLLTVPELRDKLLVERNLVWAAQIAELIRRGRRPFVAVGAGHVLGPEGLPALLEERGFTVSRVP
jgi:uncharacterized protein YbaP (TraB family)